MGFLEVGKPLTWEDTKEYHEILEYVIEHGSTQFLEVFNRVKDRKNDVLKWGDEVEFHIFSKQDDGSVKLALVADKILHKLENEDKAAEQPLLATWHPEYGSWMIEATPATPYGGFSSDLRRVEPNIRYRRRRIINALQPNQSIIGLVAWPRMGCDDFTDPHVAPGGPASNSSFLPDAVINPHPRFGTLTQNIRKRRGKKVDIRVPLFHDVKTDLTATHEVVSKDNKGTENAREIYMDSMGFGMGCCCLQVTFQARDLKESRHLYDQLAVLCPIFLALTAGAPVFKGLLAETDVRWSTIAQSVDCRTPVEYGVSEPDASKPIGKGSRGVRKISKSRYDSIDMYISSSETLKPGYNDNNAEYHRPTFDKLTANGVDEILAKHIAHLFIRDPLVIFGDRVKVDDKHTTEHFENIQSTNWQTMRWKPPPLDSDMGWRVEFRPMEMGITDFQNAAYTVVIVLLTRVILFFDLNLYIPISKVDENMRTAHKRDAVLREKFHFRKNLVPLEAQCGPVADAKEGSIEDEYEPMTIEEIMLGKGDNFPGLVPLVWAYLDIIECDEETQLVVEEYMDYITDVIKGNLPTTAKWIRNFITTHPDYKQDSVVSKKIEQDLVKLCSDISNGEVASPDLLGDNCICKLSEDTKVDRLAVSPRCTSSATPMKQKVEDFKKLRGASFQEDVGMTNAHAYKCAVVRALVDKYKSQPARKHVLREATGFANTPPFLKDL